MIIGWILFFGGAGILLYTYLLYPGIILLLGSRREKPHTPRWSEFPKVTVLFSVHNEENIIAEKLKNTLAQDDPAEKLDVLVVDDLSSDGTLEAIQSLSSDRIKCIQQNPRKGKTAALNLAVSNARGDLLVFTDATTFFQIDAIRNLVETFDAEGKIGVVCGEMRYQTHPEALSDEESHYWNFERHLRRAESRLGTLLGAHGPMYALPKELFTPLPEDMISDFMTPLLLNLKGYRTVNQPRAVASQCGSRKAASVYHRKRRIIQRSLYAIWQHLELLNPFVAGRLAFQLLSHKVLRWFTALWCIMTAIGTVLLQAQPVFQAALWCELAVFSAGVIGILIQKTGRKASFFRFPAYAVMILGASLMGTLGFLTGQKVITWEPQR